MSSCNVTINNDVDMSYDGEYTISENLEVDIYNYSPSTAGISTSFDEENREILISDLRNKLFLYSPLFRNAGNTMSLTQYAKYRTNFYFKTSKYENSSFLKKDMLISSITFYNPMLIHHFNNPCLELNHNDNEFNLKVNKKSVPRVIDINEHNILKIELGGKYAISIKNSNQIVNTEALNYVELFFINPITYEDLLLYINEFDVVVNAYSPTGLRSYRTFVETNDGKSFELIHKFLGNEEYYKKALHNPINLSFEDYLKTIYKTIDYRDSSNQNKYLPLDFQKPTSLEDKFTYYLRYIDMYMGEKLKQSTGNPNPKTHIRIKTFLTEYSRVFDSQDIADIDKLKNEINSLRAHYVHEGYYLPEGKFEVKEDNGNKYKQVLAYKWLYRIVQALKFGVYIILYKEVMGLDINEAELKYCCTYNIK